jgi:SNF2 family DNA or RNA helicase
MLAIKRMFPRINAGAYGKICLSDTPEIARDLEWFMMRYPLEVEDDALEHLTTRANLYREQSNIITELLAGTRTPRSYDLAVPARPYQLPPAEIVLTRGGLLLTDDLGVGKTCSAICVLIHAQARPALVVTMTHLTTQWQEQLKKFAPALTTHILKKGTPYDIRVGSKKKLPGQLSLLDDFPDVVICNYHKLHGWTETLSRIVKCVVFDEAQELRRKKSEKYSAARALSEHAAYKMGLTATPIYNYGDEIFSVLDCLMPGCLGEENEFLTEWCRENGQHSHTLVKPDAFGTYARSEGLMLRRTAKEVGLFVPKRTIVVQDISSDESELSKVDSPATELARLILSAAPSARGEKFRAAQELSGLVRLATGLAKAPHVADFVKIIAESGEKVVLFGWHRAVYQIWMERLADLHPKLFTGSESGPQKQEAFKAFTEGDCQVLIMSLRAGAGLDGLQFHCRIGIFGELDWSPQVHDQCGGRIDRPGQENPVVLYYLHATDGSDPVMIDVLGVKKDQSDGILDPDGSEDNDFLDASGDNVKRLAEAYLKKHGR